MLIPLLEHQDLLLHRQGWVRREDLSHCADKLKQGQTAKFIMQQARTTKLSQEQRGGHVAVKPHLNYSELAGPGFLLTAGCCTGSTSGMLQQPLLLRDASANLSFQAQCLTEPKTFVLTGRANYPDNAFLIKNQLRAKLRDFPFAQASVASVFSGKEGAWRFPSHILLLSVDMSLGETAGAECFSLMFIIQVYCSLPINPTVGSHGAAA